MPGLAEAKPPIVQYDWLEYGFDQEKSKEAGKPIPRVIPFVFITPDKYTRLEYPAEEWLAKKRNEAIEGKVNPDWVTRWEMQFAAWKKGEELPPEGQATRTWAALNKEQISRLIALGYATIEQLADCPDTTLAMIGLDGRYLRDLARKTLEQNQIGPQQAKEIADLKQELANKDTRINSLEERLAAIEANANKPAPMGLPKKG